jgi:arylsulfatase
MKRMEDFDGAEVIPKAMDFMRNAKKDGKPFFVWLNTSRMHLYYPPQRQVAPRRRQVHARG